MSLTRERTDHISEVAKMNRKLILGSLVSLVALAVLSLLTFGLGSESVFSRTVTVTGPVCGTWSVTSNKPLGPLQGEKRLLGIAVISDGNVWAVGVEHAAIGSNQALIIHWTGTKWEKADLPQLGSTSGLADIVATNDHNVWAVGSKDEDSLVLHWDGRVWTDVPSPDGANTTDNDLRSITAISPSDIWAVGNSLGSPLAIHWDGNKWSTVSTPKPNGLGNGLNSVTGVTSNDVWAVGYSGFGSFQALIMHWDGYQWNIVSGRSVPQRSTDPNEDHELSSVIALSSNDIWTVGWTKYFTASGTLIEHWDGAAWNLVPSPNANLGSSILLGLIAVSRNDVWAIGQSSHSYTEAEQVLVEHWDGSQWQIIPGPNIFGNQGFRKGVTVANGMLWIAGEADRQTMIASFLRSKSVCKRE